METTRKSLKGSFYRKLVIYFLMYSLILNTSLPAVLADAVPGMIEGENVTSGSATFTTVDNTTTIETVGMETIIEYTRFNVDGGKTVHFDQPDISAATLNRIIEANPSLINGNLTSNGRVFIINPAGVIFGETASVSVAQLVASGLNMTDDAFEDVLDDVSNDMVFEGGDGEVQNFGDITADSVYLVGKKVLNGDGGSIVTPPGGLVVIAAGDNVYLAQDGSNVVVEILADPMETTPDVQNEGLVNAPEGQIVLAAGDMYSRAIANYSSLTASSGTITAQAARIDCETRSIIDVSIDGPGSGGSISLKASEEIVLAAGTLITANAGLSGIGGSIVIDGDNLLLAGEVDASAINGEGGSISIGSVDNIANGPMPSEPALNTIYEEWIEEKSQADIDLDMFSYRDITVEHINDSENEITGGSGDIALRTVYDNGGIEFLPATEGDPITTAIRSNGGSIYMLAGSGGIKTGDLSTEESDSINPGKIRLFTNNNGDIETGALAVDGGNEVEVSVIADGNLNINGDVITKTNQVPNPEKEIWDARTCLVSVHGDIVVDTTDSGIIVHAHGKFNSTADIHICAGKNVTVNLPTSGQIEAKANTSSEGPASASILIHAGKDIEGPGNIQINGGTGHPVHVKAKAGGGAGSAEVYIEDDPSTWDETDGDAHALLEIDRDRTEDCPDCPPPPYLPPPKPPLVGPDWNTTHMGQPISGNVLSNDPGNGELTIDSYTQPEHGEVVIDTETGDYTYTPEDGFVGEDTFTYKATDGETTSHSVVVTIDVRNDLPEPVVDIVITSVSNPYSGNVLSNDTDPDLDPLTVVINGTEPQHGVLILNEDGSFTYTPDAGYVGEDSFTYTVTDGELDEFGDPVVVTGNVEITVNPAPLPPAVTPYVPAAPLPETVEFEISGCLALMNWTAEELGTDAGIVQIWMVNALASARDMHPCDACASLKGAATILQDTEGTHIAALAQVINEFASSTAPPSEEQMASIADAIARNTEADSNYALAGEYLDALAGYVGILNSELGFTIEESVTFAADKYVIPLAETENIGLAAYVAAGLAALGG